MKPINICMLGEFTLQSGNAILRESGNRSRRIFGLLSFLICHRGHPVSQYKLIEHLWGEDADIANPENTLRILLHRTRALLDQLYGLRCELRTIATALVDQRDDVLQQLRQALSARSGRRL